MQYLMKHPVHPTVEEIHKALNRHDPRASRATVYNTLHALVETGLVREVNLLGEPTRFESHVERHHHFVCDECHRIDDVGWFDPADVAKRSGVAPGSVRELVLRGLCESCLPKGKEKK
jgi:Fe2+ or Zn2+ uptake regulation protein